MTVRVFPFPQTDVGTYNDEYFVNYVHSLYGVSSAYPSRGVIPNVGSELAVSTPVSGRVVNVAAGAALVGGRMFHNDATATVSLNANTSGNPRIDLIVARWQLATHSGDLYAVEGTPASSPSIPSPTQTSSHYQIPLALVYLEAGYSSVATGYIADQRQWVSPTDTWIGFYEDWAGANLASAAPPGWLIADGTTIGAAQSGATSRANMDAYSLYKFLWESFANTELPIQDSAGTPTTRGSKAINDFIAQKRLPLPDFRGKTFVGLDNMGVGAANVITASWADNVGGTGGAETHMLSIAEIPAHNHGGVTGLSGAGSSQFAGGGASGFAAASSQGSGTAHNNLQPSLAGVKLIRYKGNTTTL